MKKLLTALLPLALFSCTPAPAAVMVLAARGDNGDEVVLHREVCNKPEVLKVVPPEHRARFHNGTSNLQGVSYPLCWALSGDGARVVILFADGDSGTMPVGQFTAEPGI